MKKLYQTMKGMKWDMVRMITLTIDRRLINGGPREALEQLTGICAYLIQYFRRQGRAVKDYIRVLEWHRDGYPHIHLIIEFEKKGMIGGDTIRDYYKLGAVKEEYIKSENHWRALAGYFEKHGYFGKEKSHQTELPDWAKSEDVGTIRRFTYMMKKKNSTEETDGNEIDENEIDEKKAVNDTLKKERKLKKYEVVLARCGEDLRVTIYDPDRIMRFNGVVASIKIPGEWRDDLKSYLWVCDSHELFSWLEEVDKARTLMAMERYKWMYGLSDEEILSDFNACSDRYYQFFINN